MTDTNTANNTNKSSIDDYTISTGTSSNDEKMDILKSAREALGEIRSIYGTTSTITITTTTTSTITINYN